MKSKLSKSFLPLYKVYSLCLDNTRYTSGVFNKLSGESRVISNAF